MRAYLPAYLVVGYLGAAWAAAVGVLFLRAGQAGRSRRLQALGALLILASVIGFFGGVPEIWTPGPAGTELAALCGLALGGAAGVGRLLGLRFPPPNGGTAARHSCAAGTEAPTRSGIARWGLRIGLALALLALARWDLPVFFALNRLAGRTPALDAVARLLINDYAVPTALAMLAWAMWLGGDLRRRTAVLRAALAALLSGPMVELMNAFYFRPRPFADHEVHLLFYHPSDSSFPSNAAVVTWAIAGALAEGDRRVGRMAMALAAGIGLARVYGGVHYPLDVAAGALLGLALARLTAREPHLQAWTAGLARRFASDQ